MRTVLNQKPSGLLKGGLAFFLEERRGKMKVKHYKKITLIFAVIICLIGLMDGVALSMVWYVNENLTSSGNGKSWIGAFKTIEEAINVADQSTGDEIWVRKEEQSEVFNALGLPIENNEAARLTQNSEAILLEQSTSIRAFDISSYGIGSGSISNALGLAVDPENGNIFLTTLSYGGEDNLWVFTTNGDLLYSTRVSIELNGGNLASIVVGKNGHLLVYAVKVIGINNYEQSVVEISQDGNTIFSSFPADQFTRGGSGITYRPAEESIFLSSFADDKVFKTDYLGGLIDSFGVAQYGYGPIDIAFEPFSENIFIPYEYYGEVLLEYGKDVSNAYSYLKTYDLNSVGITRHPLAIDINRTNGLIYIQENNERVVEFDKNLLVALSALTVISPNGEEVLSAGEDYEIKWESEGEIEYVKIEYSVNNGVDWIEIITTENDGSYLWEIPCNPSDQSLVRISDAGDGASDVSDAVFSISCEPPPCEIDAILDFFNQSVADGTIYGRGKILYLANFRLWLFRQMLENSGWFIEQDNIKWACKTLARAHRRCDNEPRPKDFIKGEAVPELAQMIEDLIECLECN